MSEVRVSKFLIGKNSAEQYYWVLYSSNGEAIAKSSQDYVSKAACERSIMITQESSTAELDDLTSRRD